MSLGNNRDYKTNARRVTRNLARHAAIMAELIRAGMDKHEASKLAMREVLRKDNDHTTGYRRF